MTTCCFDADTQLWMTSDNPKCYWASVLGGDGGGAEYLCWRDGAFSLNGRHV